MRRPPAQLALALLAALAACDGAREPPAAAGPAIRVEDAWARPVPHAAAHGAAYLVVHNAGAAADRLLAAESEAAVAAELHRSRVEDGVWRMRPLEGGIEVPAGGSLALRPGDYHVMLVGLRRALAPGERFELVLHFERAGRLPVEVQVEER